MKHDFLVTHACNKYMQKIYVYYITTCKKEDNKLTDEEKLWLIECYKGNRKLWVIQGKTRSQKALKKGELVEEFDKKFSIAIPEKAFDALRASFLQDHKKYQKEGNCRMKVWNSTNACFSWKTKNSLHMGPQIRFAPEKLQYFFCCVWMKDAACGPWAYFSYKCLITVKIGTLGFVN